MNILITGANGYIGQRLIPILLKQGHDLYCCVRNLSRLGEYQNEPGVKLIEIDLLEPSDISNFPVEIDVAYFLVHTMSDKGDFGVTESIIARNFLRLLEPTKCKQIIYLSGIANQEELSKHLESRKQVEMLLAESHISLTVLRAGIIVGSGSASFEIIRDLVEKLPVMIAPKWLMTRSQPIAVRNVLEFLTGVMGKDKYYGKTFDIMGPDILTYKQMLLKFAKVRGLKRLIITVPIMTPRLSSYWLYFITATSYRLAVNLVNSMKIDIIGRPNELANELGIDLISYQESVRLAFQKIEQNMIISSWKDAFSASNIGTDIFQRMEVPKFGIYKDVKWRKITDSDKTLQNVWSIGGQRGWYYANFLWKLRGYVDKLNGGVGLRRGRTHHSEIAPGDALDFWRVLAADKVNKRLLLFAEMKLPGEAWLEFKIIRKRQDIFLRQTATFRPLGLWGRLYWYAVLPFHYFVFNGMINKLIAFDPGEVAKIKT
ncbi:MAG: SDR family oxidoreductase [Saprospiraceae bacterium]|nr:SDR family oxidoreductase [Saprospiraceae bacterium]